MGVGRRVRLAQLLDRLGAVEGLLRGLRRFGSPWITVLTYHHVHRPDRGYPFDKRVIDAYPADFDDQVATMKRYFSVVGLEELRAHLIDGRRLPPHPALITFDDGYRSCHDCVLPILKRHGVPAVFFVATHYVDERRLFWWEQLAYLVHQAKVDEIELSHPVPMRLRFKSNPDGALMRLQDTVKEHRELELGSFLDEVAAAAEVRWDRDVERELADRTICTWDQLRAMRDAGMSIQSHTRRHRVLRTLAAEDLEDELAGSRSRIEAEVGEPVTAISYPVGEPIAHVPHIREAVQAAGYELGFSNESGVIPLRGRRDHLDLGRVGFEAHQPLAFFRGALAIPPLAYNYNA